MYNGTISRIGTGVEVELALPSSTRADQRNCGEIANTSAKIRISVEKGQFLDC